MGASEIKIGLLWHSASSGNLGVGALTLANLEIVRGVAEEMGLTPRFHVIGMRDGEARYLPPEAAKVFVVDSRSLLSPGGAWKVLNEQDCVLDIGGGDSFADIYGMKRYIFVWLTKMQALFGRTPLLLSPQTIGPFTKTPYKQMAKVALDGAVTVMARDRISLDFLRALAPRAHGVLSVDVAFALPFEDRAAERGGQRVRVGVNVSGLLMNEAVSGRNRFGLDLDYARLTRRFIEDMTRRPDVEVHLVTHVTEADYGSWEDDGAACDRLAEEFPSAIRAPDFPGPSEAKSYISSLDFLVAGRMHACIAAFSAGVPVAPIAYSRKFSGLFGLLDYPWMVPVTGMDEDAALAFLEDCLERRAELAKAEAEGMKVAATLLDAYRAELRRLFAAATGSR